MENKPKKCKGIGIAFGFTGCGIETLNREHGLCSACRYEFYMTDERGKIEFAKRKLKNHTVKEKAFKSDLRQKLKTNADYVKDLQKEINTIVRLIDRGSQCISTLKPLNAKFDAGHFYSCGSNPSLRFHLDNIHAQSVYANQYLSGDQMNYLNGLKRVYGTEYKNHVIDLKRKYPILKLTIDELKEKIVIAKSIVFKLKFEFRTLDNKERLKLREIYNEKLGIYGKEIRT